MAQDTVLRLLGISKILDKKIVLLYIISLLLVIQCTFKSEEKKKIVLTENIKLRHIVKKEMIDDRLYFVDYLGIKNIGKEEVNILSTKISESKVLLYTNYSNYFENSGSQVMCSFAPSKDTIVRCLPDSELCLTYMDAQSPKFYSDSIKHTFYYYCASHPEILYEKDFMIIPNVLKGLPERKSDRNDYLESYKKRK
jgi:hypothetical protein